MENLLFFYNLSITIALTIVITCLFVINVKEQERRSKLLLVFFIMLLADNTIMYISEYSMSFSSLYVTTDWIYYLIYILFIGVIVSGRYLLGDFTGKSVSRREWLVLFGTVIFLIILSFAVEYELSEMVSYISVYLGMIYLIGRMVLHLKEAGASGQVVKKKYMVIAGVFFLLCLAGLYES